MSEKKVKWQELKDDLTQAINTFHHPESNRSLETIERCLSGLFDKHRKSTGTLLWAGYISDIHRNRSLQAHHKDVLYGAFVKFTTSHDLLREYLKFVITIRDSVGDTNSWDEDEDEDSGGETPPPAIQPEDVAIVVTPGSQRTWREWVGSKILQNTPSLITPEPVSNVSMAVNIDKSILRLAVLNEADWVFPSDISSLGAAEQARIKKILEIGTPNDTLLETAVKGGNIKVVENLIRLLKSVNIDQSERGGMLHSAIEARRPEIAQLLVNEYPKIIEETPNNLSALQVLRKTEQFAKWKELEEFLVSKSVRRKTPSLVRRLLYDPNSQSSHLYADLSIFNDPIHNFDAFLASLEEKDFASLERKKYKVNFYSTLMYVKLPRLRNKEPNSNREEAFIVLNWLRTRSVRTILELHVPDAIKGPHTDELIEKWLGLEPEKDGFKSIETLNWERLDLSLETLKVIRGLQNVYLYTENWNTLAFWTSTEGLCSKDHENIQEVTIVIVQDNALSKARADKYRDKAIERVNRAILERDSRIKNEGRVPQALTINVKVAAWGSEDSGEGTSDNHASNKVTPRQVTDLDHFLRQDPRQLISAREILADNFWPRPTRVAIIDNGVDAGINKIWDRVAESESFVEDDTKTRESSVWLASHPHGTQMASIVTDIDPHCLLYIAKVGTGKENLVSPDNIIAAIKWLAEFKVDVVVISLTLKTPDPGIAKAISNADDNGNGPVFLCATEDVGITGDKVYPAYFPQTIAIAACDRGGKESIYTDSNAHYYFQGYQIHTDCLSYGARQTDEPSGSSIATAIGAGVASLILSCKSLADAERRSRKTRLDTVKAVFNDMIDKTNSAKYVSPGKLFKGGEANGVTWSADDWKNWIQNMFQPDGRYS